jgi:DNA-binding NarL/FixJ family response regulator
MRRPSATRSSRSGGACASDSEALRILVADDARVVRRILAALLTSLGHTVVGEAASLQETVAAAIRLEPDVAFVDIALIDDDPQSALDRILEACPASQVIVCAPQDRPGDVRRVVGAGARSAVVRPFLRSRLAEVLAQLR